MVQSYTFKLRFPNKQQTFLLNFSQAPHLQHIQNSKKTMVRTNRPMAKTNRQMANSNQSLANTNQSLESTNQSLVKTNQSLVKINQSLVNINQSLVNTNQSRLCGYRNTEYSFLSGTLPEKSDFFTTICYYIYNIYIIYIIKFLFNFLVLLRKLYSVFLYHFCSFYCVFFL